VACVDQTLSNIDDDASKPLRLSYVNIQTRHVGAQCIIAEAGDTCTAHSINGCGPGG
jgi:hypothetical protein